LDNQEKGNVLKEEILNDARKKAERILKKAQKEAASVLVSANKEAASLETDIIKRAEVRAKLEANKISAGTGLEIKNIRLSQVNAFLKETAAAALQKLQTKSHDTMEPFLLDSGEKGAAALREQELLLHTAKGAPLKKISALLKKAEIQFTTTEDENLHPGEIILETIDKHKRYEAVFSRIYEGEEEALLRVMYGAFFGGTDG